MFRASILDLSSGSLVIEATGSPGKVEAMLAALAGYGVCEVVRTGRVGLNRGGAVITDGAVATGGLQAVPAAAAAS